MWWYLGAAAVGALAAHRKLKPKTRLHAINVIGVRTGRVYKIEEIRELGHLVAHTPNGGRGLFERDRVTGSLALKRFFGHPQDEDLTKQDLEPPKQLKTKAKDHE